MAAQQAQIAETIRAMKLAFNRHANQDSESEGDVQPQTNRGNKMKRSARFARYDQLDNTGGLAYRRRAKHAGYSRSIIATNPALYDSEGELVEYSSEDERPAEPAREDAFAGIHLHQLLKPLTAVDSIVDHPSLSLPFTSSGLSDLVSETAIMLRTHNDALWRVKRLLKRLEGDTDWAPLGIFETEADTLLLNKQEEVASLPDIQDHRNGDVFEEQWDANGKVEEIMQQDIAVEDMATRIEPDAEVKDDTEMVDTGGNADEQLQAELSIERQGSIEPPGSESASTNAIMHAMTTRARARSPQTSAMASPSPSDSASVPNINSWFLAPLHTLPDRDLGLPADEAEHTRKLLLLYCQKQEQIIRSLETLYSGLQRGERLRKHIYDSAKAAGHLVPDGRGNMVTAMADGEDWYDESVYGVLEKGKDEAEDAEDENRRGGRRRRVVGRVNN